MFRSLGAFVTKRSWWVLAFAIIFIGVAASYGTSVFGRLDSGGFAGQRFESYQALQEITDHFGGSQSLIVLFQSRNGLVVTDPAYQAAVERTLQVAKQDHNVTSITDFYTTHSPQLISRDHRSTFAVVNVGGSLAQATVATKQLRPRLTSNLLNVQTGGTLGINQDFNTQISKDLAKAETISFIFLAVLLVVVFRSLVAALLPLMLGGVGVLGAFLVVRLLTNVMTISQYAINVIILLGLGLSIDYSLFMVSRFREELRRQPAPAALMTTMQTAGRTVFFSGLTVILSLLGLLIFPINFLQSMGIGASAAVVVAMAAALTVLPAIMSLLGNRINALSFGRVRRDYQAIKNHTPVAGERRSIWYRVAQVAMWRPVLTIGLIVVPLSFLSQYFFVANFSSADYRSLPVGTQSRQVAEALNNNFPGGNNNPIQIVIQAPAGALTTSTLQDLQSYTAAIGRLPGVTQVSSILTLQPLLPLPQYALGYSGPAARAGVRQAAAGFASGDYELVNVSYNSAYDQSLARTLVQQIRTQSHSASWDVKVGGTTASLVDLLASLSHYAPYAVGIVAAALFILLMVMFGSVVIPLQALFVNALSLSATFGVLVWIFQEGHLTHLLDFTSVGSIDATQPVLIFGIAFGLSMDYSVFLLSRIKEQYDQSGEIGTAIAEGLQKTGPIITSAAALFIVVVAAFATSAIPLIKQIGVGLAVAVFLDAFLIRMLLIPAIMRLCGRANWWGPQAFLKH
jgi:RND superfamily putative drug exporter